MIAILGDLHGLCGLLEDADKRLKPGVPIIQVGDFGWYPNIRPHWNQLGKRLRRTVYWIDGNHEYFPEVPLDAAAPVEVAKNIVYVPRGTILELDGKRIGCLGGAASVDYKSRKLGRDWFLEEAIRPQDAAKVAAWDSVDLMVTHVPPQSVIQRNFPPIDLVRNFGLSVDWRDPSADVVEAEWRRLGMPPLYCGHMHRAIRDSNVTILDEGSRLVLE